MADSIDLFLSKASSKPQHPAVAVNRQRVTYGTLEDRARRVAAKVSEYGAPKVLIALSQGPDAYAAMLGVGLGGGYYAPVNVGGPRHKLDLIARLLRPDLIVGTPEVTNRLGSAVGEADVFDIHDIYAGAPLIGRGRRHELAYVLFTSGTTSLPKGVIIPRSALDHYVASIAHTIAISAEDKVSQHPNIAFDLSVMDIYGALCFGATLCPIATKGDRLMPARAIDREKVSVWISVPSVIGLMMRAGHMTTANLSSIRLFAFCGEPLLKEHLDAIFMACPDAAVVNTYGPTEATVSMTSLRLTRDNYLGACSESVAIGKPVEGMELHLIGGPDADEGEIVICGPQLAAGYWQNPEQTAKSFRTLDLNGKSTRAYCTGDWGKRNGEYVFFKGRLDFQVKVLGYRLELDEVGAAIRACGWPEVCVVVWRNMLTAVIEAPDGTVLSEQLLRCALAEKLERHAIPVVLRIILTLPRTENDKVDIAAVVDWLDSQPHCPTALQSP